MRIAFLTPLKRCNAMRDTSLHSGYIPESKTANKYKKGGSIQNTIARQGFVFLASKTKQNSKFGSIKPIPGDINAISGRQNASGAHVGYYT